MKKKNLFHTPDNDSITEKICLSGMYILLGYGKEMLSLRQSWITMVKYTHLIERCSGFLRTGVAWKLKSHGYTFSEAYWRLREGKGLQSGYDKESMQLWGSIITQVRRNTGSLGTLTATDRSELNTQREALLKKMEAYRDVLEAGTCPTYLYNGSSPVIVEHVLYHMVGETRHATPEVQQQLWYGLDLDALRKDVQSGMSELSAYQCKYQAASPKEKEKMEPPATWTKHRFGASFVKDKVWQIRTGHDERSSVNAGINERLNFIWDIPSLTDEKHRAIYEENLDCIRGYRTWKEDNRTSDIPYETMRAKVYEVVDRIRIPDIG